MWYDVGLTVDVIVEINKQKEVCTGQSAWDHAFVEWAETFRSRGVN